MNGFERIWIEQCEAAERIREEHGIDKAFGYLVGEKLMNFLEVSKQKPEFRGELPHFVARVCEMFPQAEIERYLRSARRVGAPGHVLSDEDYEEMREAGAFDESPVRAAQDLLLFEEMKRLLGVA